MFWWSTPWLRQLVFPDVRHHNWCGKSAPQWMGLLVQFGLAEDHDRFSSQSVMHRRRHRGVVNSEQPQAPTISVSSAACRALVVYWHMKATLAHGSRDDGLDMAGVLVDGLLEAFFGNGGCEVQIVAVGDSVGIEIQDCASTCPVAPWGGLPAVSCVSNTIGRCSLGRFTRHMSDAPHLQPQALLVAFGVIQQHAPFILGLQCPRQSLLVRASCFLGSMFGVRLSSRMSVESTRVAV